MSQGGVLSELGTGDIAFLAGNSGGNVGPSGGGVVNVVGAGGVTVAGNSGTNTLTISVSGSGLTWNVLAGSSATMVPNNGYATNSASLTTLTLPAASSVGDYITVVGMNTGGWTIVYGAGQQIRVGANISTTTTGSVSSFEAHDSIDLVCVVANTLWLADGAPQSQGLTIV